MRSIPFPLSRAFSAQRILGWRSRGVAPGYYISRLQHESAVRQLMAKQLIDLSHIIEHGLITYKGLPAPIICDFLSREQSRQHYTEGTEFQIGKIEMVANTGTYLYSPFHRYEAGKDLSEIELRSLAN